MYSTTLKKVIKCMDYESIKSSGACISYFALFFKTRATVIDRLGKLIRLCNQVNPLPRNHLEAMCS